LPLDGDERTWQRTVTLPKPQTSGAKSEGCFGKPDFVYLPAEDIYRCPAGEKLTYRYTTEEDEQICPRSGRAEFLLELLMRLLTDPSGFDGSGEHL
jgi:hypothetical protein